MVGTQAISLHTRPGRKAGHAARGGFTLIDLLVSMAVVAVLIALMMPSLSTVREAARKVVCSSNLRQIGLGMAMYADDNKGMLPYTKFANPQVPRLSQLQAMMMLRTGDNADSWDGIGQLFAFGYLDAPGVFYCPSHHGEHPFVNYSSEWGGTVGEIFGNFQFRGADALTIDAYQGGQAMVADGMRVQSDINHRVGANVLRANLSVGWYADVDHQLAQLPETTIDPESSRKVDNAWQAIDHSSGTTSVR